MNRICGWCPECLAKRPDVQLDYPCPDCRGSEARAERQSVAFLCNHHPNPWLPKPKATKKAQRARKARPKKSRR